MISFTMAWTIMQSIRNIFRLCILWLGMHECILPCQLEYKKLCFLCGGVCLCVCLNLCVYIWGEWLGRTNAHPKHILFYLETFWFNSFRSYCILVFVFFSCFSQSWTRHLHLCKLIFAVILALRLRLHNFFKVEKCLISWTVTVGIRYELAEVTANPKSGVSHVTGLCSTSLFFRGHKC